MRKYVMQVAKRLTWMFMKHEYFIQTSLSSIKQSSNLGQEETEHQLLTGAKIKHYQLHCVCVFLGKRDGRKTCTINKILRLIYCLHITVSHTQGIKPKAKSQKRTGQKLLYFMHKDSGKFLPDYNCLNYHIMTLQLWCSVLLPLHSDSL